MAQSLPRDQRDSFTRNTGELLVALAAPCLISVLAYGYLAVRLLLTSALTALVCEALCKVFRRPGKDGGFWHALYTGLTLAMLLPAGFSLWKAALGAAFAVLIVSLPFGGAEHTPFSPTAAAFVFLCLSFPKDVFTFTQPVQFAKAALAPAASSSLASMLQVGESVTPNYLTYLNIIIGNVPAAMGTASMAVLAGVSVYLLIRRRDAWITSASFVTVCALAAILFPRVLTGRKASLLMEISSGSLVFAALFLLPQASFRLKSAGKRMLYGCFTGLFAVLLGRVGIYEDSSCLAILLMNCFWPALDGAFEKLFPGKRQEVNANAAS